MFLANRALCRAARVNFTRSLSTRAAAILSALDLATTEEIAGVYDGQWRGSGDIFSSTCPTTGENLARVRSASPQELHDAIARAREAYTLFRHVPAPRRGEILRQIREALAAKRNELGALVSLEMGKIRTEGEGEVQEFIDIIVARVLENNGIPGAVASLVTGDKDAGAALAESRDIELVSFTGSESVGRIVSKTVTSRFGKTILELGGNNASIVMADADLSLAVPAVFFGAVASEFLERLQKLYTTVKPGDPLVEGTLLGPLHSSAALKTYSDTIEHLRSINAEILIGGDRYTEAPLDVGNFVRPTISIPKSVNPKEQIWSTETFAPILNAAIFDDLDEAISWNNAVPQVKDPSMAVDSQR
ncbi:hypothetical protein C0992_003529 [Termitomyces sp. T32_za158]|nr:hypothetical protein C0992_003529 [Termitomyces sp. T32_za158]